MLAIVLNILPMYDSLWLCVKDAFFNVATIISTTGFCTVDYCQWPMFSQLILLLLMFIGGCAGSTAGGLKISRVIALVGLAKRKLHESVNPKRVSVVVYEGKPMNERAQNDIALYFILYTFVFFGLVVLISFENLDFITTFSAVATTYNNVGPASAPSANRQLRRLQRILQARPLLRHGRRPSRDHAPHPPLRPKHMESVRKCCSEKHLSDHHTQVFVIY